MASVKRFPDSKHWFACFKIPTTAITAAGCIVFRRVQHSTGLVDRDRALQMAISLERAAIQAGEKRWTERSAQQLLREISAISGTTVAQIQETEEFLANWLGGRKRHVAESTFLNYQTILRDFLDYLGTRRKGSLADVTSQVIAGFRDAETATGKAGTTVKKALSVLRQAFEEAVAQQAMERNPAQGITVKGADKRAQTRKHFTFEQFRALVQATAPGSKSSRGHEVHPDWQTFIITSGYTAGRQQEVAQLRWENIDFDLPGVHLIRIKNIDRHLVMMHRALRSHLLARRAESLNSEVFVMPHLAKLPKRRLSKVFRETILPRIGISQPYAERTKEKGFGRKLAGYSPHSLRHSTSTWLDQAGVSEMMRMRVVGHEDEKVSRIYTHTELQQQHTAVETLPDL